MELCKEDRLTHGDAGEVQLKSVVEEEEGREECQPRQQSEEKKSCCLQSKSKMEFCQGQICRRDTCNQTEMRNSGLDALT